MKISLILISKGPIDNESALVWVMAHNGIDHDALPKPRITPFTYVNTRHNTSMCKQVCAVSLAEVIALLFPRLNLNDEETMHHTIHVMIKIWQMYLW